ncbi:MAG: protein BatD [Alistipes sp.]|nr:protein BatD [Alistipes sp.]MBQ5638918.1 protein BatD [Alistipes sp.]
MRKWFVRWTLTVTLLVAVWAAYAAGKPVFEASSPLTVAVGEAFRVEFALNASPDDDTFKAPSFEGFDVLAGPAVSRGSSISIVNGSMTKSVNVTYTFVLLPKAAGNVTIGVAEVQVEGETVRTNPLPIQVVDEGQSTAQAAPQNRREQHESGQTTAQNRIAEDDVLLRAVLSRTSVYKNEPLRVTYKLYTRVPFVDYSFEAAPSFNGFWAQDLVNKKSNAQSSRETYNGKVYETYVLGDWLLYPQQAGKLAIDPMGMTIVAQVVVQSRNYDPFFGSGHEVYNVPRKVQSQPMTVTVKPLPEGAPASFSGAVGQFTMECTPPASTLAANSAATYTVRIAGTGNLTFVQAPKLNLPSSFEQYHVKTTESINTSAAGITGYRQFEYPFIARAEGEFEVEPVEFSYFDPQVMMYKTLSSKGMTIAVSPDVKGTDEEMVILPGRGISKEEVKLLGEDIRFIKLGQARLAEKREPLLYSGLFWWILVALGVLFQLLYFALRKQIKESQNLVLVRGKRANKVALKRFRAARTHMEKEERHAFYEEMLRALWGYMGDKFNIPVANLTKESVRAELLRRGITEQDADRFTEIITRCDEAQYSPQATSQMNEVYRAGVELISDIEAKIKR